MLIVASGVDLTALGEDQNSPLIGFDNHVVSSGITATSGTTAHPATELANPATDLYWLATSDVAQDLILTNDSAEEIDYVGIAGHNFAGRTVTVLGDSGAGYTTRLSSTTVTDNSPLILRFVKAAFDAVKVTVGAGSEAASAAVMYAGELTVIPRKIYVGHSPLTYARDPNIVTNRSENGKYLGSVQVGGTNRSTIDLQNLPPAWVRENIDPILQARDPFFWAWRPYTYPLETGYVWLTGNPKPSNQRSNGMMSVSLPIDGEV